MGKHYDSFAFIEHNLMNSNRIYLYVLLSIFAAFIPALLLRDFNALNELNYLGIAQEALERGSWFAFYENGVPYADKPPVYLWICMLAVAIAGVHAMPLVLLASVLPFIALISLLDRYLAYEFRHQERLLIMLGMGSMLVMDVLALVGRMDMLFSMVMLLAYLKLMKRYILLKELDHQEGNHRPKYGNLSIPFLLFLAVFIKGPYGILFPLLAILVLMALNHDYKRYFAIVRPHYFVIVLLLVSLWGLCVYLEGGADYFNNLFFEQSAKRLGAIEGVRIVHQEPFYFFFKIFLVMTLPVGLCALYFMARQLYLRESLDIKIQACLSFVLVALVVLSIPKSKLEIYLLPALPMVFYYVMLSYRAMQLERSKPLFEALERQLDLANQKEQALLNKKANQEQVLANDEQNEAHEIQVQLKAAQAERDLKSETLAIQVLEDNDSTTHGRASFSIASSTEEAPQSQAELDSSQSTPATEPSDASASSASASAASASAASTSASDAVSSGKDSASGDKQNDADSGESISPVKLRLQSILQMDHQNDEQTNEQSSLSEHSADTQDDSESAAKQDETATKDGAADLESKDSVQGDAVAVNKDEATIDQKTKKMVVFNEPHKVEIDASATKSVKSAKVFNAKANISPTLVELSERQGVKPWDLVGANEPQHHNNTQETTEQSVGADDTASAAGNASAAGTAGTVGLEGSESVASGASGASAAGTASAASAEGAIREQDAGESKDSDSDSDSVSDYELEYGQDKSIFRYHRSGHQGVEIIGQGYFLSGINTVGERTKLPKLLSLAFALPLVVYIALFGAYFFFYEKVPALQNSIIGISFGVLSFASVIALFFLLSRLFIFSLAALGVGTLSFVFILGFAIPHLNPFLGMGEYAKVATQAIDTGASNKLCMVRYRNGLDMKFYDKRIDLIQDPELLDKCLEDNATIVLNRKGIKEHAQIAEQMRARGAYTIGESLVLPAKSPEAKLPFNFSNGQVDGLPVELKLKSGS